MCEGRKVSYVCEASQSHNRSTSVDERDSSSRGIFERLCARKYLLLRFYYAPRGNGMMCWCNANFPGCAVRLVIELLQFFPLPNNYSTMVSS